jgi:NADPH:quinone reductase-like Zn-dependent oxidoreductase
MDRIGGPEVLQYRDVPEPVAGPGQLLVDVHAVSLNPGEVKVRNGARPAFLESGFPHTMGRDFSGVVRSAAPGVTGFNHGDAVFGVLPLNVEGTAAEVIAVDESLVARKPDPVSHADIVALALTGLTALYSMEDAGAIKAGETVLIHGGAGGIGSYAVQYARSMGARVITTASARNHEYVKRLGAEEAIDYNSEDFTRIGAICDVVLDSIGGEVQRRSLSVLKPGGRLVIIAASTKDAEGVRPDVQILRPIVKRDRRHLERIAELAVTGAVKPPEITRMKLSDAVEAHRRIESGSLRGKIVFVIR